MLDRILTKFRLDLKWIMSMDTGDGLILIPDEFAL